MKYQAHYGATREKQFPSDAIARKLLVHRLKKLAYPTGG
jgi:hypothetical protein